MIDHIGIKVSDVDKSKRFFRLAPAPIAYTPLRPLPAAVTGTTVVARFGEAAKAHLGISAGGPHPAPVHAAFATGSRAAVDAFHRAALAGTDNGAPGPRPHHHADHDGAFALDTDGQNIAAVCHAP